MKLYAQIGFGDGQKTASGLGRGLIDGAILGARDVDPARIGAKIAEYRGARPDAEVLLDPQFYATFIAGSGAARIGHLGEWPYFAALRKSDLEIGDRAGEIIRDTFECIAAYDVSALIAPNIFVSRSFDSREGVIAKAFVRAAKGAATSVGDNRPVYATVAISREALLERVEFEEFLNDITMLKEPPDGIYLLVGGRGAEAKTDIYHADVIARWMLMNHSLSINGFAVVNGYSDILTPFLGAAGGTVGACGWYSNLRQFSLDRYQQTQSGGRQPIARYLSAKMLNRITFAEREALGAVVRDVDNGLPCDGYYDPDPDREQEVLQSWEALQALNGEMTRSDVSVNLAKCGQAVRVAEGVYANIARAGIGLDRKSSDLHLEPLKEGIAAFRTEAGISE